MSVAVRRSVRTGAAVNPEPVPPIDPTRCPLCGGDNDCGVARGAGTCWCFSTSVPDAAIEQLPDGARTVFVLHDVEGYRHEEIGDILGVSPGTSKSQLHRARQTLRVLLMKKKTVTQSI